jgi:hypothetical protein
MHRNAFIEHKECYGRKKKITRLIEKAFLVSSALMTTTPVSTRPSCSLLS